ncbi:thiamine pyrophosphate-dependent dehydrogenase E1 component subunit alpha [Saccharopolyspora rosea]|uniref:thiamine pyrophosphate-dependent dehydrogenase E1 component subunit alpha n=1 Tax=Saccharopolyspora rosea TaxID=524884 RepID=UPI0021DB23AA|nr:thiamine pyrophosphate-dependent enzyme [Saccharopolyspora rosea]
MSEVDTKLSLHLYRTMLLARRVDEEAVALQRQGVLPAYAPMRGQEAAQVGSASVLDTSRDFAFPTYRELGVALALGVDPVEYMGTHVGAWHGGMYDPMTTRFAPINAVVGGAVTHAVGWAMGADLDGTGGVAMTFFGDGASSQGDVHEAMNFAAVYRLPVVFLCQNNGWAISTPTSRQVAGGSVAARAAGYDMPGHRVDGNDVLAVREAVRQAVARAREGGGPSVVEAMTYRLGPHSTSDDPGRYRSAEEERDHAGRDPLTRFAARLRESGTAEADLTAAEEHAAEVVARVRAELSSSGDRPGEELFDFVYREPTAALLEQRRQWREDHADA